MATVIANESKYRTVIEDYFGYKLRQRQIYVSGFEVEPETLSKTSRTLRRIGDELENENQELFLSMCDQLQITPNTAYPTFQGIADEIFQSGKNWGRIVAFICFGACLASHAASRRNDMGPAYVERILNWVTRYMDTNLDPWISANQSWDGFVEFFGKPEDDGPNNVRNGGFLLSAVAGLGLGALLMLSCK